MWCFVTPQMVASLKVSRSSHISRPEPEKFGEAAEVISHTGFTMQLLRRCNLFTIYWCTVHCCPASLPFFTSYIVLAFYFALYTFNDFILSHFRVNGTFAPRNFRSREQKFHGVELSLPRTYNLTLIDCLIIHICICFSSVGTVTETGTETAVFWQYRTEAKPRF